MKVYDLTLKINKKKKKTRFEFLLISYLCLI